jgi:hypothetical protein
MMKILAKENVDQHKVQPDPVVEAQGLILDHLLAEYRKTSPINPPFHREALRIQLRIDSKIYAQALERFIRSGGGLLVELTPDHHYIRLGPSGLYRARS